MHLGFDKNEYGTEVSKHKCDTCGEPFTICPAATEDKKGYDNCSIKPCTSYDVNRDLDILFMSDDEISKLDVVSFKVLKARKDGSFGIEEGDES